ncbi:MAG: aminotransferase class V-fold PLP-dependent enzyme, partial [Phycisphaerales bacterium]
MGRDRPVALLESPPRSHPSQGVLAIADHTESSQDAPPSYDDLVATAAESVEQITPDALAAKMAAGLDGPLVDVRERDELPAGTIPGSIHLPRGLLEREIPFIASDREAPVYLHCESGKRGTLAAETLRRMGYRRPVNLAGGIEAWSASGQKVDRFAATRDRPGVARDFGPLDPQDWASIRADFPITGYRCSSGGTTRSLAYLDHAATTHPCATILRIHTEFLEQEYANVHRAGYALARSATLRFERCFEVCAEFVGGNLDRDCVVFTANTTAGCDLVAHVMAPREGAVLVTGMEHHSNDLPHRRRGGVLRAEVDATGRLEYGHVEELLKANRVKLLAVTGAANLSGWTPDLDLLARLAHEHGALICVDAAQLLAHKKLDVKSPDDPAHVDFVVAAGHKMYAPFGAGFVYGPRKVMDAAEPWIPGGGTASDVGDEEVVYLPSPDRHQGGTPNVAGIVALAAMAELLMRIGMDRVREHEMALLRRTIDRLKAIDGVTLYGPPNLDERVAILPFNIEGVDDMLAAAILGEEGGVAVRNGRFCAHPHARRIFGEGRSGAVRASIGLFNVEEELDRLVEMVARIRRGKWTRSYEMKQGQMSAQLGGRCADKWMQASPK